MSNDAWLKAIGGLVEAGDTAVLARRAVELARERLGLERCSLWLRHGDLKRGTFGTDLRGELVDERDLLDIHGLGMNHAVAEGLDYWVNEAPQHSVQCGLTADHDWLVVTPVRCKGRVLGVFYNDSAITRGPWDKARQRSLVDLAELVGQLLSNLHEREEAEALSDLASALASAVDVDAVASAAARACDRLFEWDTFRLSQTNSDGVGLRDIRSVCRVARDDRAVTVTSAMRVPIVSAAGPLGEIALGTVTEGRYADEERATLAKLAALLSPTLQRIADARRNAGLSDEHAALLRAIPDPILVYDGEARCVAVPAPERLLVNHSVNEIVGRAPSEVFGPEAEPLAAAVRQVALTGEPARLRYSLPGRLGPIWLDGRGVPMGDSVLWIARDVTELVRAEEDLRQARVALDHAAELAKVGAWQLDFETMALSWSESMCRLHGLDWRGAEIPLADVIERYGEPEDCERFWAAIENASAGGGHVDELFRYRRNDGELRQGRMVAEVQRDERGRPRRLFGMLQDITEQLAQEEQRRVLEAQLAQAGKMEAVGQLAGGVAHDFNNLLTTINGYTEFLLGEAGDDGGQREDLEEIQRAAQRAAALTRQLLAFSRRSPIRPANLDLNTLVHDMERLLRRLIGEHIDLDVLLSNEPLHLMADPSQVEQVVMNLVVNAKDAMPTGGLLTVRTGLTNLTKADLGPLSEVEPGRFVTLTVEDTGCGMSEEVLARAFEPFFTTKPVGEGTGLGLATVYGAVRQNRGHITCNSRLGLGTRFVVYLPAMQPTERGAARSSSGASGGDERILLVEDDPAVRGFVQRALVRAGYGVVVADSGEHAMRLADDALFNLLITDVIMPGLNGRVVAERLLSRQPDLRVLYISGYTATILAQQGLTPSQHPLLVKPFGQRELLSRVRQVLDGE